MRADWTISGCCHLVVLGAALVSFAPSRPPLPMVESIPVNIVTDTKTSQMTQGLPTAPKLETPKPDWFGRMSQSMPFAPKPKAKPVALEPAIEIESRRSRPDEEERSVRVPIPDSRKRT